VIFPLENNTGKNSDIFIINLFFLVGKHQETMVNIINFLLTKIESSIKVVIKCGPATAGRQDY